MIKKELSIGLFIGLFSNLLGILLYILLFSDLGILESVKQFLSKNLMGMLIAAGALLNLIPFFFYLKKNKPYRARGVLMATFLAALAIAILKLV